MSKPLRVGIIGLGQIAQDHLENYSKLSADVKIVAGADLFPGKVEAAKAKYGIEHGYADFAELLKRDDIDAVDVCVHNNKHAPIAIAALKAGKHVYCEKPMAGAYRDAEAMINTAKQCDRRLHIQMNTVFETQTRAAKRLIDEGQLGHVYHARSFGFRRRGRPFVDGYGTANFVDKAICGGGALFDMGIYHIARILHLLGNPAVQTVTGTTHQRIDMYEDRRAFSNFGVEEMGLGWVRLAGGISFDIEETWAVHYDGGESSKVLGSKGGIKIDPLTYFSSVADLSATALVDLKEYDTRWHSCDPKSKWLDLTQRNWVGHHLGEVDLVPTAEYALNTALISEGIYMSGRLGKELTADQIKKDSVSTAIDPYTPEKVWK